MSFKEKAKQLFEKITGRDVEYQEEEIQTEGELALDNNRYESQDYGTEMRERAPISIAHPGQKPHHNLRLYKLEGHRWNDIAKKSADDLKSGCSVMINTEKANKDDVRRLADFLSGGTYMIEGDISANGSSGYIFLPANCDIGGDIERDSEYDELLDKRFTSSLF